MTDVKELEKLEKIQEKIVKKKKAHTERAKEKGDSKGIEKAQAEEDKAIAVLERIREDKKRVEIEDKIFGYVKLNQPTELEEIAKTLNLPIETIEKHIEELGLVKDEEGGIYSDVGMMSSIKDKIKSEELVKRRKDMIKKWSKIAEKNPGLTREELKEIYIRHFPEDAIDIERYLEETVTKGGSAKMNTRDTAEKLIYEKYTNQWGLIEALGPIFAFVLFYLIERSYIPPSGDTLGYS